MFKKIDETKINSDILIRKYELENKLKLIFLHDPSCPVFAYHTWYNVGSRHEKKGKTGMAHFFEHLMFKETKNTPEGEFDRILEREGGSINAATYLDWTFYRESMPSNAFSLIPKLESDRMVNVILSSKQLEAERDVVLNERKMRVDNSPSGMLFEQLYLNAFQTHPYHYPVIGLAPDIESITVDDCLNFYKSYYAPNQATVVVVGDLNESDVLSEIEKHYGHIQPSTIEPLRLKEEAKQDKANFKEIHLTLPSEKIFLGFKTPQFTHPDHAPLSVLQSLLTEGKSSLLYKKMIEDRSLLSEIEGYVDQTVDPGMMVLMLSNKPGVEFESVMPLLEETLNNLKTQAVSDLDLMKVKNQIETSFWSEFSTTDDKAQYLGFYELVGGHYAHLFKKIDELKRVTPDDLLRVAKTYLVKEKSTCVIGKPK